ncbi:hypothetical protein T12_13220 [Trichinella patagoniensis]|uniref:Uncharacterized protein n=1 Tax=Trichinella patagoniensis TaxID=990121 RepID=A0A0V1A818_9BILA|nr:hypothetical protein T12_13220 [Trichinella patagoniensis]
MEKAKHVRGSFMKIFDMNRLKLRHCIIALVFTHLSKTKIENLSCEERFNKKWPSTVYCVYRNKKRQLKKKQGKKRTLSKRKLLQPFI